MQISPFFIYVFSALDFSSTTTGERQGLVFCVLPRPAASYFSVFLLLSTLHFAQFVKVWSSIALRHA